MKSGRSLQELAAELSRQSQTRKDFLAPQGALKAVVDEGTVKIAGFPNEDALDITPHAHGQLATHLGIPKAYYDRMLETNGDLLTRNVNAWVDADADNKRMVRVLDGRVRAFLSPKFRPLDNFELATAVLPTLLDHKVQILSAELTETRMYIKGILPELSDELPAGLSYGGHERIGGDRGNVVAAITISNSDIGAGTLRVEPGVFTTRCTNLMTLAQAAMKKYHAGRAGQADDESWMVFADETRRADDAAFWLKVRDITVAAFDEAMFRKAIESIRKTTEAPITGELPKVIDLAVQQLALPPALSGGILTALAAGGDLTQWGLSSAITRVANDANDYELATELERAGGKVIALPERDWSKIAAGIAA